MTIGDDVEGTTRAVDGYRDTSDVDVLSLGQNPSSPSVCPLCSKVNRLPLDSARVGERYSLTLTLTITDDVSRNPEPSTVDGGQAPR